MPLLRIEVCDFKSYRGHQVIGPFSPFTSVIGPNGAGKSNLMDAISFVLGVKSLQLRSSQLKDLIYRGRRLAEGTQTQDESVGEGDAQKAWVLAIYQDSDKKELQFKRTISLNGSSEYRLNDRVVTYQAYNAALETENILVKAKNFLVFQGDVEAIASQSPKDLTRLIEQIAGSLELAQDYERAKAAQERATENATFNFTKRRGIVGEIRQFKEQKQEAERFQRLVDERDAAVLQRLLWKLYHIESRIEANTRAIKTGTKALAQLRLEQVEHDKAADQARAEHAKARSDIITREKKIKKQEKSLDKKKPELVDIDGQIAHAERKTGNAKKQIELVQQEIQSQELKIARQEKELEAVKKAADAAQAENLKAAQQNISLSKESMEEYHTLRAQAALQAISERQQLESLTREEKSEARALSTTESKLGEFQLQAETLEENIGKEKARKAELEERNTTLSTDLAVAKSELEKLGAERARLAQLEDEAQQKVADVHQKLMQAGVDQKESEREARLKEALASLQRVFSGVRGRVVDLCKPTQRKFEVAVGVVLGRNIDAVVVDTEKTAIECIEYMRNQRVGQATFIPLDTIRVKPINDKFRSFAKGARLAVDVIQFDPTVERAMHHACGNALVCDSMEVARYICYDKGQEVKAVTLEGTVIHKSGLITGGRSTQGSGKKWEEADVQKLRKTRETLAQQLQEIAKQKPRANADDPIVAEIQRLQGALQLAADDLSACRHSLEGKQKELRHVRSEIKKLTPEAEQRTKHLKELRAKMSRLSGIVNAAEDGVYSSFCRKIGVADIRVYQGAELRAVEVASEARLRFDGQIARMGHQLKFEREDLETRRERLERLNGVTTMETNTLKSLSKRKKELEKELERMQAEIKEMQDDLDATSTHAAELGKDVEEKKRVAGKTTKAVDKASKEIGIKNDEIEQAAVERSSIYRRCKMDKLDLPLASGNLNNVPMDEKLADEVAMEVDDEDGFQPKTVQDYGIEVNFSVLDDDEREDGSGEMAGQLEGNINKLTVEIERMVPNMKATDRLDDVEAKLADTEKDADKARKESKSTRDEFNDIKKRRCDLFNRAYEHISNCIDQVYKDLTKGKAAPMGGVAYLSLEDSEEPYLSGIKYHAMPPMKRFRDMEQLSGGEKTVAALALLFAIHSYQPAPFFVLDEVDAALDNTNVAKIANYIQRQASDAFQFIVISLKGSLYERGNSLVGIYRDQDVNSSRTLTLDLTRYDG
ncbi:condensin complex subunit SMC1 [Auriculariales sp. MPI-PUGE-AT-0066]|nr:condensin complex subunit SMC1 [Auriculariales sp. MPI-PUGE-AT-0066]